VTTPHAREDLPHLIQWIKDQTGDNDSDVARRIGVAPATVNAWVHAKRGQGRGPAAKNLRALSAAYSNIGLTEERVFAAVGRRRPGPLTKAGEEELLKLFAELTEEQQRGYAIQIRATVEDNRSGA
jgi:sirohydrochlorin ferrochelatase